MTVAFIRWAMDNFSGQRFGLCGKTVDSCIKNLVIPYISMHYAKSRYILRWRRADKILEVTRGAAKNYFEVFGGKDESSAALIQGRTLAGVLLDEVPLMPESFFNQALARCSVEGAKMWFSCNPDNPQHWFYTKWIQRHKERNALYLHFTMKDNPSLSEKTLKRYEEQFAGVFYDRYIKGLWVAAEGLVYPMFDKKKHVVYEEPSRGDWYISIDYGTLNPFAAELWRVDGDCAVMVDEYYYDGRSAQCQKTDVDYYADIERLAGDRDIQSIVVDPSAASFITLIQQRGKYSVVKANNAVLDGVRSTAALINSGNILIHARCRNTLREFNEYSWDKKAGSDTVIKESDHAMDSLRYLVQTVLQRRGEVYDIYF